MSDKHCPDCAALPGEKHKEHCDVERCPHCGFQFLSCECSPSDAERMPWTGEWPGVAECREYGLWCRMVPGKQGWQPCEKDDPGATEDMNRLYVEYEWDRELQKFV